MNNSRGKLNEAYIATLTDEQKQALWVKLIFKDLKAIGDSLDRSRRDIPAGDVKTLLIEARKNLETAYLGPDEDPADTYNDRYLDALPEELEKAKIKLSDAESKATTSELRDAKEFAKIFKNWILHIQNTRIKGDQAPDGNQIYTWVNKIDSLLTSVTSKATVPPKTNFKLPSTATASSLLQLNFDMAKETINESKLDSERVKIALINCMEKATTHFNTLKKSADATSRPTLAAATGMLRTALIEIKEGNLDTAKIEKIKKIFTESDVKSASDVKKLAEIQTLFELLNSLNKKISSEQSAAAPSASATFAPKKR